jgi:hypothetical protein
VTVDPDLKAPLERLAEALHRAIEESDDVEQALGVLREQGFQAYLLLEVTVALGRTGADGASPLEDGRQMGFAEASSEEGWLVEIDDSAPRAEPPLSSRVAPDDREFLKSIRIRID